MNLNAVNLLAVAAWVSDSFPIIRIVLVVLLALLGILLTICVLFQEGNDGSGIDAVSGSSSETFYAKNKSQTLTSTLKRLTVIIAIAMAVIVVAFFVTVAIYSGM